MKIKAKVFWIKPESKDKDDIYLSVDDYEADYLYFDTDDIVCFNRGSNHLSGLVITFNHGNAYHFVWNKKLFEMLSKDYKEIYDC